tara:strand:- start:542 stop:1516 length:975 start_codon:yes stop_codon:yes gene_type:complete
MKQFKNILITGGCGFIATNFISYLFEIKKITSNIINIDKLSYASNNHVNIHYKNKKNYSFYKLDIGNFNKVSEVINKHKIDCIINFAAESHVDNSILKPEIFIKTNIISSTSLLKQTINKNIHFHQISTDEVFGSLPLKSKRKFKLDDKYDPSSPYSASKAAFDLILEAYSKTYKINHSISYCSNNYGPFQHKEKLLPKIIENLFQNKKIPIYGKGENIRDWIYVEDHCEGLYQQLKNPKKYKKMIFGGNTKITNLDITKMIVNLVKKNSKLDKYITFVKDRPAHDTMYQVSNKESKLMGWEPSTSLKIGIIKTINWYKENYKY